MQTCTLKGGSLTLLRLTSPNKKNASIMFERCRSCVFLRYLNFEAFLVLHTSWIQDSGAQPAPNQAARSQDDTEALVPGKVSDVPDELREQVWVRQMPGIEDQETVGIRGLS